ncbi:hypothetical protein FOL47_000125 [Perkinsus chesapeaki]|uniref:Uncharacterized protein n=1 Tax=Perkinsus chesapeaki TaxID=330153 RepID=A0A7J6N1D9_PERCH|nr:hypothetical protein FOL47_000125 [Perkinsus chesapeaki]
MEVNRLADRCSKAVKADYDNGGHEIFRVGAAWHDTDPNDRRSVDGYAIEYAYTTSWKIYITNTTSLFLNVDPLKMCSETPSQLKQPGPLRYVKLRWDYDKMKCVPFQLSAGATSEALPLLEKDKQWEYIDELKKLVDATEAVDSALPLEERCRLQLIRYGDEIYKQYTEKARTKRVRWEGLDNDEDKAEAAAALLQLLAYGWQ